MHLPFTSAVSILLLCGCGLSMNPDLPSARENDDAGGGDAPGGGLDLGGDPDLGGDQGGPINAPPGQEGMGGALPCQAAAGAAGASQECRGER